MKKLDFIIVIGCLIASLFFLVFVNETKEEGDRVVVRINGVITNEYYLSTDGEYSLNNGSNILVIKDGKAYLIDATCPDKTCVRWGAIQFTGETITCLPNKLTIVVEGKNPIIELEG